MDIQMSVKLIGVLDIIFLCFDFIYIYIFINSKTFSNEEKSYKKRWLFISIAIKLFIIASVFEYYILIYILESGFIKGFAYLVFPVMILLLTYLFLWLYIREGKIHDNGKTNG